MFHVGLFHLCEYFENILQQNKNYKSNTLTVAVVAGFSTVLQQVTTRLVMSQLHTAEGLQISAS